MKRISKLGLTAISLLTTAVLGCDPSPDVAPAADFTRIRVELGGAGGRFVSEGGTGLGHAGLFGNLQMACDGKGTSYCVLDYCNGPNQELAAQSKCGAPTSADGRYHVTFTAEAEEGARFDHWELTPDVSEDQGLAPDPTIASSNPRAATIDVSWAVSGNKYKYKLAAIFSKGPVVAPPEQAPAPPPPPPPPPVKAPLTTGCTSAPIDLIEAGVTHPSDLLVLCGSIVTTKKDGSGAAVVAAGPATSFTSDDAFVYFDAQEAGGYRVHRTSLAGGASQPISPLSTKPITWIGVDKSYVYFIGSSALGDGLYSAFKDGTAYPETISHLMYSETKVAGATVDGANVIFAFDDNSGNGTAKIASLPQGSDNTAIPMTLAAHVKLPKARLHQGSIGTYWGTMLLDRNAGTAKPLATGDARDSFSSGSDLYFTTDTCVSRVSLSSAAPVAIDCKVAPTGAVVVDATSVFWLRANEIAKAPK